MRLDDRDGLPGLDGVRTAGSARDLEHGLDDLVARARANPRVASLVVADGEVHPDHVPWLARAGVRQFHVADQVRPGRSRKAYVDEGPTLKRFRPRAQGRAYRIRKRTSHITVVVSVRPSPTPGQGRVGRHVATPTKKAGAR